eukprot:CAMPEP_0117058386 /NCGR_PEP_ID=MMETSP0472-20121206/40559_1 /TAXON_ID=693140 ORGANISM="Tiarina fusus, Strain LIS" /NCGR_SAMPLE_ID=MMETSP0472 /ASSEMBLY_ACC=CAM_ASM_000603 /LENGTH=253 /DNA_ID=CAMNT_0004775689 /DNA_START=56 /DNA_END=817 /DNA_ORIENTATION=-
MIQSQEFTTKQALASPTASNDIVDKAIDTAIETLKAAKQDVAALLAGRQSLASEKAGLTSAVDELREEKTQLEIQIENMKLALNDLGERRIESQQNHEMLVEQASTADGMSQEKGEEVVEANDDNISHNDDDNNLSHNDDDDMLLDSQETVLYFTQPTEPTVAGNDERVVDNTDFITQEKENAQTGCDNKQNEELESVATTPTADTKTTTGSVLSSSSRHKRRARKSYNSPKKWRRMIRSHRLQSVFVINSGM